ncbi:hypothetical protein ACTJKN_07005 [Pedobacter sp. 22163]|uniref:hypothetical protein n=1 Tax=Pedobacter sp. 22163 TaxID=3453883 RepID=UPI003F8723C1
MRDIIEKNEGKLTTLRFIGFCLMAIGVLSLMICSFETEPPVANVIAVSFFITMLGFSLAFPSLLEGSEGLSTMRIVVFMMTNVICMLMLKIGWASGIKSLENIGIDQYWVGIIAFTFGAKATQSFFESRIAVPKHDAKSAAPSLELTNAELVKLAIAQNGQFLKVKFPNILTLSDAVQDSGLVESHVVAIYIRDDNDGGIPPALKIKMPDGSDRTIQTEIIKGTGKARIQYSQLETDVSAEAHPTYFGSVCCMVRSKTDHTFKGIVTSGHIYSYGRYDDFHNGILHPSLQTRVILDGDIAASWSHKMLNEQQDLAIAKIDDGLVEDPTYQKFNNAFYTVGDKDVKTAFANITMLSREGKTTQAYIIDYNVGLDVSYKQVDSFKSNVILVGSTNDRQTARPISVGGDSGSCIYHTETRQLIGILLGRANNFSLVLPIEETLKNFNLETI